MSTSAPGIEEPRAVSVKFERGKLCVALEDGREIGCPLALFPRLAAATAKERAAWAFTGKGEGIFWPALDEDLSVRGLLDASPMAHPEPGKMAVRGAFLLAARRAAGLTQTQLAERLGKSQALVSLTERGKTWTGDPYRLDVLKACGLPVDWAG